MKFGEKYQVNGNPVRIEWRGLDYGELFIQLEGGAIGEIDFVIVNPTKIFIDNLKIWGEEDRNLLLSILPDNQKKEFTEDIPIVLEVPHDDITDYLFRVYNERIDNIKKHPIEVRFKQKTGVVNSTTIAFDKWILDDEDIITQFIKYLFSERGFKYSIDYTWNDFFSIMKKSLKKEKVIRDGMKLLEYVTVLSYDKLVDAINKFTEKKTEETRREIENIKSMSGEELVRRYLVGHIHINKNGWYSDDPDYAKDCVFLDYFLFDTPEQYLKKAEKFYIMESKKNSSKQNLYYIASSDIIKEMAKDIDLVEKIRILAIEKLETAIKERV